MFQTAKGIPIVSFADLVAQKLLSLAKQPAREPPQPESGDSQASLGKRSPQASLQPRKQKQLRRGRPPKPKAVLAELGQAVPLPQSSAETPAPGQQPGSSLAVSRETGGLDCYPGSLLDLNQPQSSASSSRSSSSDSREDPFGLFL